jgi:molybdopterin synthase catalytic subunit
MLYLQEEPLPWESLLHDLNQNIGACLVFAGIVRNATEDNHVKGISYSAYDKLCYQKETVFEKAFAKKYPDKSYTILHRLGYVPLKETSLLVKLYSPHRQNSFDALEEIVEWIKSDLPVWKKIFHTDGSFCWKANHVA